MLPGGMTFHCSWTSSVIAFLKRVVILSLTKACDSVKGRSKVSLVSTNSLTSVCVRLSALNLSIIEDSKWSAVTPCFLPALLHLLSFFFFCQAWYRSQRPFIFLQFPPDGASTCLRWRVWKTGDSGEVLPETERAAEVRKWRVHLVLFRMDLD